MRAGEHQAETLLTFILSSRNDRYQGDSVWRLTTALNFLAANIEAAGESEAIEVIVTDWGSRTPLREVLELTSAAREAVRFLEVAPDLAARLQGESPFPEVLANNAAIRRARGRFIGRIDQDTLVDKAFLVDFLAAVRNDPDNSLASSFLIWGRRSIPRQLTEDAPPLEEIQRFLESCGNWLPKEGGAAGLGSTCPSALSSSIAESGTRSADTMSGFCCGDSWKPNSPCGLSTSTRPRTWKSDSAARSITSAT